LVATPGQPTSGSLQIAHSWYCSPVQIGSHWLYFQENTDNSERWQYRPRFYIPFSLPRGWTFTQRLDLPVYYTDKVGPENPNGGWKSGIGDWFIEEIFATPELAKNFRMSASVRFVFPTGGSSPFGSDQYQWAPSIGATYAIPEHKITLGPLARYFMSYHATEPGAAKVRKLDLYPTVTFALPENWSLASMPSTRSATTTSPTSGSCRSRCCSSSGCRRPSNSDLAAPTASSRTIRSTSTSSTAG
jgi:hypothetical protein